MDTSASEDVQVLNGYLPEANLYLPILAFLAVIWLSIRVLKSIRRPDLFRELMIRYHHPIALMNKSTQIMFWNDQMKNLTGISAENARGRRLSEIDAFPDGHPVITMLDAQTECEQDLPIEFRTQISTSTEEIQADITLLQLNLYDSAGPYRILTVENVTAIDKPAIQTSDNKSKNLSNTVMMTEIDRLKSEFLAICGHELKTPLVSISGYLELLLSGKLGSLTQKQINALEISQRSSARLNELLGSLLDFAHMEAGKIRFEFSSQRLHSAVEEAIAVMHPMAGGKKITIINNVLPKLPRVKIDSILMHRVFMNIIDNSIKFTPSGGLITIDAEEKETCIRVEIHDTGIGIDMNHLKRIKEPFFQADTSDTRRTGGLGLGLAIVDKILEGHGSRLDIERNYPIGLKVSFTLQKAECKRTEKPV